jgi:hypothetical protein
MGFVTTQPKTTINVGLTTGGFTKPKVLPIKKTDLGSVEGLTQAAEQAGLGKQAGKIVEDTNKLSFLQRLSKGLSAFNPAQAISTGQEKGLGAGLLEYPKSILSGVGSAITGKDYEPDRKYFADIAEKAGIKNGIAKFGIGFLGDVLLDPTTYFGGAIAKGLGVVAKGAGGVALKGIGKIAPEAETGLKMAGTALSDAVGKAFVYGYKSSKGSTADVLTFLSKEQKAKLGLAASNLDRLGTGILTSSQREELALKMIAGKRAEFVAREAGKTTEEAGQIAKQITLTGTSKEVAPIIENQITRSKKFAEGITENPYETYFPFIKKDKLQKFLNESKGIKVGSEGYRKQFKNLLTNENLELDPAKAFFTRESQIVSDRMTKDFLEGFVAKYGKPLTEFKNSDEALSAGYKLIKEKGIFGKEVGYVKDFDAKLIRDSISPEFQTVNMLAKATGFDAVTSLFKRSVTGLFAPFHVRNFVSGQIQNFEALGVGALNPKNIAIGQKIAYYMGRGKKIPSGIVEVGGKTQKFSDVIKPFVDRFSGDTFYNADFDMALKNGSELKSAAGMFSKQRVKETLKTAGLGQEAIPFKVGRAIGQFIEHQQKATAYVTALSQGKSIPEALKLAETAGFDYRALTAFESQIMRRIIPFYSFTRKNIELQLKTLGENPERINQVIKFFSNTGELFGGGQLTEEEKKNLPDFIKESLGVKLGDTPEGLKQYISSFGTPIEAFTQLFGKNPILRALSMTNPILKVPVELGIGKDSFRQRDLKDVYTANEYEMAPQFVKDLLEIKPVTKPIYQTINDKSVKTGEKTAYIADPERLLIARSLFTSRGVSYLDQVFGNDLKGFVKVLKTTTGIKPQQVDIESQKYFNERDKQRALEDMLNRYGVVKKFEKSYIPKK